jgi:nicotinamidase-related amidase
MGVSANRETTIEAKPNPIAIEIARTALIVVDMQNDFCSTGGLLDRAGINISAVQRAVYPMRKALSAARESRVKIVYLKMGFQPDLSDLGDTDSPNRVRHLHFGVGQACIAPDGREGRFLIRDTWNTDIIKELCPQPEDVVLYKHRFSGFYQTELDNRSLASHHRNTVRLGIEFGKLYFGTSSWSPGGNWNEVRLLDFHWSVLRKQLGPSMRRPVSVKADLSFFFLLPCFFFFQIIPSEPSRLCRHPSIRTLC